VTDEPESPFTQLAEGAIQLHEWYRSMREAGFTESEAVAIVVGVLRPGSPS
jgi:hypothetical protein